MVQYTIEAEASLSARRAWIEIGNGGSHRLAERSLSARRAWIEIQHRRHGGLLRGVALRKESVDRNPGQCASCRAYAVALRKESVDRNFEGVTEMVKDIGRSPQGERG